MMTLHQPQNDESLVLERRRGLRIQQSRPIKVYEPMASRYFGGQTCDISATGLRIELPVGASVRPGCTVCVHVGPNDDGQGLVHRRQMIPVRVIWVDRRLSGDRPKLMAGVEFTATVAAHLDAA